jgi:hypothetical protein
MPLRQFQVRNRPINVVPTYKKLHSVRLGSVGYFLVPIAGEWKTRDAMT